MNVVITSPVALFGGLTLPTVGWLMEIPEQYYQPACMTRLGTALTSAQQAALRPWSLTVAGAWLEPINGE